jgi:hypothetical protein
VTAFCLLLRGATITQLRFGHCIAASKNRLAPQQIDPQMVPFRERRPSGRL